MSGPSSCVALWRQGSGVGNSVLGSRSSVLGVDGQLHLVKEFELLICAKHSYKNFIYTYILWYQQPYEVVLLLHLTDEEVEHKNFF